METGDVGLDLPDGVEILGAPEGRRYWWAWHKGEEMVEREGGRDAELIERVEARVQAAKDEVRTSAIPPMDPDQTAEAVAEPVGYPEARAVYLARELCEERSCIEAFLERGGLTEREEGMARLWLRWDDVAHGMAWPGQGRVAVTPERACDLRSRAYAELATSYSQAVGRPGSKVRSGAPDACRPGGLVLTAKSVREREEEFDEGSEGPEAPVLTLEDVEEQIERSFDTGGALGVGDLMAWLKEFVQMRGDEIEAEQREVDRKGRGCVEQMMAYLRRRRDVLDGQRIVVGALVRAIEERDR